MEDNAQGNDIMSISEEDALALLKDLGIEGTEAKKLLLVGVAAELSDGHTTDPDVARKLAMDHFQKEGLDYYDKLLTFVEKALRAASTPRDYAVLELMTGVSKMSLARARMVEPLSYAERLDAAKYGAAMQDGSCLIAGPADMLDAVKALKLAADKPAVEMHIKQRAYSLGMQDLLPVEMQDKMRKGLSWMLQEPGADQYGGRRAVLFYKTWGEVKDKVAQYVAKQRERGMNALDGMAELAAQIKEEPAVAADGRKHYPEAREDKTPMGAKKIAYNDLASEAWDAAFNTLEFEQFKENMDDDRIVALTAEDLARFVSVSTEVEQ